MYKVIEAVVEFREIVFVHDNDNVKYVPDGRVFGINIKLTGDV
jgi:hypothetical protein